MNKEGIFGYSKIGLGILGAWYGLSSIDHIEKDNEAATEYGIESVIFLSGAYAASRFEKKYRANNNRIDLIPEEEAVIEEDSLYGGQGLESPDSQTSFPPKLE
jgi:hypothetical protein